MQDNKRNEEEDSKIPAVVQQDLQQQQQHREVDPGGAIASDVEDEGGGILLPSPPPHSNSNNLTAEDDDDDDDDVDAASTAVIAAATQPPSSVHGEVGDDEDDTNTIGEQRPSPPVPHKPELTLKEKLVLRERQRRIETERARLKRQFALSGANNDDDDNREGGRASGEAVTENNDSTNAGIHRRRRDEGGGESNNSATEEGTLGEESTRAHPDDEETANDEDPHGDRRLGFNMERFLRNSDSCFNPQLEPMDEENNNATAQEQQQQGVVMERFLNDPVVVPPAVMLSGGDESSSSKKNNDAEQDERVANADRTTISTTVNNNDTGGGNGENHAHPSPQEQQMAHRSVSFDIDGGGGGGPIMLAAEASTTDPEAADSLLLREASNVTAYLGSSSSFGGGGGDGNASLGNVSNVSVQASSTAGDPTEAALLLVPSPTQVDDPLGASMEVHRGGDDDDDHVPIMMGLNDHDHGVGGMLSSSSRTGGAASDEQPRVLRLTEADMQEMASIEEASIGNNAPPSARGEEEILSEIGELADFAGGGGGHHHHHGAETAISQDTPTTAMESSSSQISGRSAHLAASSAVSSSASAGHSNTAAILDHSLDGGDDDHHGGVGAVPAIPPTVGSHDQRMDAAGEHMREQAESHVSAAQMLEESVVQPLLEENVARVPTSTTTTRMAPPPDSIGETSQKDEKHDGSIEVNHGLVNRPRRHSPPRRRDSPPLQNGMVLSPSAAEPPPVVVHGFDFDKDAPRSPYLGSAEGHDSFRDLPVDTWSPAGKMHISPLHSGTRRTIVVDVDSSSNALPDTNIPEPPFINYGALEEGDAPSLRVRMLPPQPNNNDALVGRSNETTPLLAGGSDNHDGDDDDDDAIPPEIVTRRQRSFSEADLAAVKGIKNRRVFRHLFSTVRSDNDDGKEEVHNESEVYRASSMLARAFPERQSALIVTLIFEIPVLVMITGRSDALCQLVGRSRYHLLIGFLPLTSAISGNVGLQASTLTTRAISHYHVTPDSYMPWFLAEVGTAAYLGVGMGLILGSVAYVASGMDFPFGFTIFIAQFISIVTAGITGTFAPLLFSFIFKRDSGKWGGPLETAIQDIVGSFAMVVVSYHILQLLGAGNSVDPSDVCYGSDSDSAD